MVLSQGRVSLEQRLGTALQTAILLILSLFLCCFSNPTYLTHWRILYHTHSSRLPRLSSPGLGSLLNHLAEHCVVYWANWIPQYRNQKMLSSINRLRQLIARDKAKQPQLKNQLTKSHELSQPTIRCDKQLKIYWQGGNVALPQESYQWPLVCWSPVFATFICFSMSFPGNAGISLSFHFLLLMAFCETLKRWVIRSSVKSNGLWAQLLPLRCPPEAYIAM